jgi:uncharacterized protein YacL (UPF0231 family)
MAVNPEIVMNYQFVRDQRGHPIAQFEMGCELFSHWFAEELGTDQNKIAAILEAIQQLENKEIKAFVLEGNDITLSLDPYEVELRSKILDVDAPNELPEGTELYDQESISGCGLEDFYSVLSSWNDFVAGK